MISCTPHLGTLIRPVFADGRRIKGHYSRFSLSLFLFSSTSKADRVSAPTRYGWYCGLQCSLFRFSFFGSLLDSVCHAMSLCAACTGAADLRQSPCTLWCRLRAAGECRHHARATATHPQTVSWPFPLSPTNTGSLLLLLSGSLLGSLLLILLFGSSSSYLLVLLPAHIQAAQGLPQLLSLFLSPTSPACLLLDTLS